MEIRPEQPEHRHGVRQVHTQAFGQSLEADLVDALRAGCGDILSFAAIADGQVVGHLVLSPVVVTGDLPLAGGMGLGPVAVLPARQRQGIGSALIRHGICELRRRNCPFLIVLGHPGYYRRFGFEPASRYHLRSEWDVPDEAFMALALSEGALDDVRGVVRYRPEYAAAL